MMPAASVARRLRRHWALAAVCAAFLLAGAQALDVYGLGWPGDQDAQRRIGQAALDYLAGDGERAFDQLSVPSDRYYGAIVEAPLVLAERIKVLEITTTGRIPGRYFLTHLLFLLGGVACYLLVLRLFGSRPLALVAMVLFLLHPRLYAYSFFNSKDVPFLVAFMVSLYLVHRAFRRETLGAFILCGAGMGLLVNLRVMGLALFAAVLALRALDLFVGSVDGRKRVALTGGAFALAAVLTYYVSLPALWTDPFGGFAELVQTLNAHPNVAFNLFRGERLYSRDGPPLDYVPVWIAITTPPATLLLTLVGAAALLRRSLCRPRDLLRDGPVRFGLLLVALPVVTVVTVVVLKNNLSDNWRQLFFLYAPLLLLATFGIHALLRARRGRWMRAGAYALAGATIAVALVSMVRVHPHLHRSFTLLTDRTTPGRLASTYAFQQWGLTSARDLLAAIARDHPAGPLYVSSTYRPGQLFPGDGFVFTRDFHSGERNFIHIGGERCPVRLAGTYVSRHYGTIRDCFVDPVAYLGGYRREALATEPLARSRFDAYRVDDAMVYLRDDCSPEDMDLRFFLRVHPVAAADRRAPYGFEKRDFAFAWYGASIDGDCVAAVPLPDHPIARIDTGQYAPEYGEAARRAVADAAPVAHSRFDVWLDEDERTLTWVREACSAEDMAARFRLHVYPVDEADIAPAWRREEYGFDNLNFDFPEHGVRLEDGACVLVAPLPAYPIANIHVGQFVTGEGARWGARFAFSLPEVDVAALAGEPLARSVFDVHHHGDALVYVKDGCTDEDADAAFALHFYPVDANDLPEAAREHGFENRDFLLWERGGLAGDGRCLAVVDLPDYPIARVETGQYDDTGRLWWAEFALAE